MKASIEIDQDLMKKVLKYSGLKTKKEIINTALEAYVKYQMRLKILSLQGKVKFKGNLEN